MSSSCSDNRLIMGPTSNRINMELLKCIIKENSSGEIICVDAPLMKMDKITEIEGETNAKILSIKDNSITSNFLATGAVNNSKIADCTIRPAKLAKPINTYGMTSSDNKILLYNGTSWEYAAPSAGEMGITAIETPAGSALKALTNSENQEVEMCVVDDGITESKLANNAVTTGKISDKSITLDKLADGSNNTEQILLWTGGATPEEGKWELSEPSSIGAGVTSVTETNATSGLDVISSSGDGKGDISLNISTNGVQASMLASGSVTTEKIVGQAITTSLLATDAVTKEKIKDSEIITSKLASESVTEEKLASASVTNNKIKDGEITPGKLADGTNMTQEILVWTGTQWVLSPPSSVGIGDVTSVSEKDANSGLNVDPTTGDVKIEIKDDGVTESKIADGAVSNSKLATNSVTAVKIANNSVDTSKLTDNSVSNPKLTDDAVTTSKIAENAVTTSKIADGNVTEEKLAADSVTSNKIVEQAIDVTKFKNGDNMDQIFLWSDASGDGTRTWELAPYVAPTPGVTSVTATGPLISSGTNEPNISLEDGTSANQILLWNGSAWTIADSGSIAPGDVTSVGPLITEDDTGANNSGLDINPQTGDVKLKIATSGVVESMIKDGAVHNAKIADGAVTDSKIADGSITPVKFTAPSHAPANKPWPAIFLYINDFNPRWATKYLRFFWNPIGGLLEEVEINPDTGEALASPDVQPNSITINSFENVAGSNDAALSVKGLNPSASLDDQDNKTALFIESGTSTMESNTIQSTLNLKNNMTDSSDDGNKAAALNIYDNAIRVGDAKYFFPVIDKCAKGDVDSLVGKSLVVRHVKYDKESQDTSIINDYIPNIYFGYSP